MSYRANEKLKYYFRLKSRQMTVQVRIQAWILLLLYFALAGFQIFQEPRIVFQSFFWLSISALAVGTFLLFLIPRSFRWKV